MERTSGLQGDRVNRQAWKLHQENVALRFDLKTAHAEIRRMNAASACAYCGHPARKGSRTCDAHRDLPSIDPGWRI